MKLNILRRLGDSSKSLIKHEFFIKGIGRSSDTPNKIEEQFKSLDEEQQKKWNSLMQEKGIVEHPFDYEQIIQLVMKFGVARASVDKYHDFILGPGFYVQTGDKRADLLLENINKQMQMYDVFSRVIKGGLPLGTIVTEISVDEKTKTPNGFKIIPPNTCYIKKDDNGNVTGVVQKIGRDQKLIEWKPEEVAIFTFNKMPGKVYGEGIIYCVMRIIEEIIEIKKHRLTMLRRKANSPIVATLGGQFGDKFIEPAPGDVTAFGKELEILTNKTEYAVDYATKLSVLDFGNVGEKFNSALKDLWEELYISLQIPETLFGKGNIAEGLGNVNMDAFQRRVQSLREEFEKVAEESIYRKILDANGFTDLKPEIIWGLPSDMEKNEKLKIYTALLQNPLVMGSLRNELEKKTADALGIELKMTPEEEKEEEISEPQPKFPGVAGAESLREFIPPEAGDAPQGVKDILKKIYDAVRSQWVKDHPDDKENSANKASAARIAWDAVKKAGWHKTKDGWKKESCACCYENVDVIKDYINSNDFDKDMSITEYVGFNFQEYLGEVLSSVEKDKFENLLAKTDEQKEAGLLTENEIDKLKYVLKKNFKEGKGIRNVAKELNENIDFKNRYALNEDGKIIRNDKGDPRLQMEAKYRPIIIARTEILRKANDGALDNYKKHGYNKVKWLAALSERTCEICLGRNGQIYDVEEARERPHVLCRCATIPITELTEM